MKERGLKFLKDIGFKDKRVFFRADFNVPLKAGQVQDGYRIDKAMPGIRYILDQGGRLLLASHLGRPKGKKDPALSMNPVAKYLSEKHGLEIFLMEEPDGAAAGYLLGGLKSHQAVLLENLRFHPGEKGRDKLFAMALASSMDVYVNEGFGVSHRDHSSLTLVPEMIPARAAGPLFQKELEQLGSLRAARFERENQPSPAERPFFVILGGGKTEEKIPLLESLINQADGFFIGGRPAFVFLKAKEAAAGASFDSPLPPPLKKQEGAPPVSPALLARASFFMERLKERGKSLWLPVDHVILKGGKISLARNETVPEGAAAMDIGPETRKIFCREIRRARSLFWNGPLGLFEKEEFAEGTRQLMEAVAGHKAARRIVGGGHSAAMARGFEGELDHVSTGGGASLSYLRGDRLPGLQSLLS